MMLEKINQGLKKLIKFPFEGFSIESRVLAMLLMSGVVLVLALIFKFMFVGVLTTSTHYFFFCFGLILLIVYAAAFLQLSVDTSCHLFAWVIGSSFLFVLYEAVQVSARIDNSIIFLCFMFPVISWPFFKSVIYFLYALLYIAFIVVVLAVQTAGNLTYNNVFISSIDEIILHYLVLLSILMMGKVLFYYTNSAYLVQRDVLEEQLKENRKEHFKLYKRAYYDFLTGLYNRMMMEEQIRYSIKHAEDDESSLGLLFIDLDGFKEINDKFGHKSGDECLIEAARRFNDRFEKSKSIDEQHNFVARIAGDEFIVVLVGVSEKKIIKLCEELLVSCVPLLKLPTVNEKIKLTFSIGAYRMVFDKKINPELFSIDWKELRTLLFTIADRNMYRAKRKKNSYYISEYSNEDYKALRNFGI